MINKETSNYNAELIYVSLPLKFSLGAFGLGFSQRQHYWNFGPGNFFVVGAYPMHLCTVVRLEHPWSLLTRCRQQLPTPRQLSPKC